MKRRGVGVAEIVLLSATVLSLAGFVVALIYLSANWGPGGPWEGKSGGLLGYWISFTLVWLLLGSCIFRYRYRWKVGGPCFEKRDAALVILAVALLVRVVVVLGSEPRLSDDVWRYIHDGATLARGQNPYALAPDQLSKQQVPVPGIFDLINHTDLVTIYQPMSQYVFALLEITYQHSPAAWQRGDPRHDRTFRLGFVLIEMVLIGLLMWGLVRCGRSLWWAALYAWHPLAISEVAGSGHQDVIGILPLVAGMMLASIAKPNWKRTVGCGAMLALAIAVKPIVLPLLLPLAWPLRRQRRYLVGMLVAVVGVGVVVYLPFLFMDGGLAGMVMTIRTFMSKWAFNGSVYPLLTYLPRIENLVDPLLMLVLLGVVVMSIKARHDLLQTTVLYFLLSLLLSSTVHAWYLLWVLALMPLRFNAALWLFSLTVTLSYAAHINRQEFQPYLWLSLIEYLPVYALGAWMCWHYEPELHSARSKNDI